MDLNKLIRDRRTIQIFTNEIVSDNDVKEALELSLWAPNHRLTFPWFYMIVDQARREKLANLSIELKSKKTPDGRLTDAVKASMRTAFLNPSHYVALGLKKNSDPAIDKENFATLACSVQLASLVLWEKGIGSKWTTSGFSMSPKTYEILGISMEEIRLEGGLMIGKFAKVPPVVPRPSIDKIIR